MDAELAALWSAAATTLVALMTTDSWERVKAGFAALWHRARPEQAATVEADLEAVRVTADAARRDGDEETLASLAAEWQSRLQRLAASDETLQAEVRRLVEEFRPLLESIASPAGPVAMIARASGGSRINQATASGSATVNQAGGNQTLNFFRNGVRRPVKAPDAASTECPYPGLAPFSADQADWFYGREQLSSRLVSRLDDCLVRGSGPLMVVAASGAGKSSLLRAGLLPQITARALPPAGSERWPQVVFTPGRHPMRAAAAALRPASRGGGDAEVPDDPDGEVLDGLLAEAVTAAGPGARAVLVVDQFEELFRLCEDEAERGAFISWLWRAARGEGAREQAALAVCALRADFYPDCLRYPLIQQALQDNQVLVGAMSPDELSEAITFPAVTAGLEIGSGLTELLLTDLHAEPASAGGDGSRVPDDGAGRLPLLAHALRVTWQQREGDTLTVEGYKKSGRIEGAIAVSAEQVFGRLGQAAQRQARRVFLRMVKIGATGSEDVRRPVSREDLASAGTSAQEVADRFTEARLLTQSQDTVQITHEALLRAWPRLASWLNDDRTDQLTRQRIEDNAAEWVTAGGDKSLLYRGGRLDEAAGWAGRHTPDDLTPAARKFIAESRASARRARRIQRGGIAILVVLLLVASVATPVAVVQRATAVRTTHSAQADEKTAQSEELANNATGLLPSNAPLAMLLSLQADKLAPTLQATSALIQAVQQPLVRVLTGGDRSGGQTMALSPDGRTLAVGYSDGHVALWDTVTGRDITTLHDGPQIEDLAFSRNGRTLAISNGNDADLWDVTDPHHPSKIAALTGAVAGNLTNQVAFSPDGRTVAVGYDFGYLVILWDVAVPKQPRPIGFIAEGGGVASLAFSPDGRTLAVGDQRGNVGVWNVTAPRAPSRITTLQGSDFADVDSVTFSHDGRTLAAGDGNDGIRLWNTRTYRETATLNEGFPVASVALSPDGRTLAAGDSNGGVGLWSMTTGQKTATLPEGSAVTSVGFSPGGSTLLVADATGDVAFWDPARAQEASLDPGSAVDSTALSPDGAVLAVGGSGVGLWNVATGRKTADLDQGDSGDSAVFSPDGRILAVSYGSADGGVGLWNVSIPQPRKMAPVFDQDASIYSVAFSPDEHVLAVGYDTLPNQYPERNGVDLWNLVTGRKMAFLSEGSEVTGVAFSRDGRTLAVGYGADGDSTQLWDVSDPQQPRKTATLQAGQPVWALAFSPDGRTLAVSDVSGHITLWGVSNPRRPRKLASLNERSTVQAMAFSPRGAVLVVGDDQGNLDFWNTQNRGLLATVPREGGTVESLSFSRSGQALAVGTENNRVALLRLDLAEVTPRYFTTLVCGEVRSNVSRSDWATYAVGVSYRKTCP